MWRTFLMVCVMVVVMGCQRNDISEFGPLKLGGSAPFKPGDPTAHPFKTIPQSKFYIYVADKDLPPVCVFDDCGANGEVVERMGGWLSGDSTDQPEIAWIFGLEESSATSMIIVADRDSKIVGIYPNHNMRDILKILKRHPEFGEVNTAVFDNPAQPGVPTERPQESVR